MTDGATFLVRHSPRWHEVPLAGDAQPWADSAARTAWELSGRAVGEAKLRSFAASLASVCEMVRGVEPVLAFVFTPEPWAGMTSVFLLAAAPFPGSDGDDSRAAVVALLGLPDERLAEPQEVADLETAAGTAVRVRKRLVQTDDAGLSTAVDQLNYAWPDPAQGLVLIGSTSFSDPVELARWEGEVDGLARGMTFEEG